MIPCALIKPDFEIFIFPKFFANLCREFFAKFRKMAKFEQKSVKIFRKKIEISKSGFISAQGTIKSHSKTKMGVLGPTSAENFGISVDFQVIFWPFSPINSQKYPKRCHVRGVITRPPVNIFQFCKKFLNPHIPNFKIC